MENIQLHRPCIFACIADSQDYASVCGLYASRHSFSSDTDKMGTNKSVTIRSQLDSPSAAIFRPGKSPGRFYFRNVKVPLYDAKSQERS